MALYMPLFRRCATITHLKQLHAHLLVTGLHHQPPASTKLIESYHQMDSLTSSNSAFFSFPNPDPFMWGVIIKCHVWSSSFRAAISLYFTMLFSSCGSQVGPFVFPSVLKACGGLGSARIGAKVHCGILKAGVCHDEVIESSLVDMYGELGLPHLAWKVFDDMLVRDLVSWSSLVSCYIDNSEFFQGLESFRLLMRESFDFDSIAFIKVADACGELQCFNLGRSLHGHVVRKGIQFCNSLINSMIAMYSKCGELHYSMMTFAAVGEKTVATWTSMIAAFNRSGCFASARASFKEMMAFELSPNFVTMLNLLCSCTELGFPKEAKSVHCFALKRPVELEMDRLSPALIEAYADCGNIEYCERVLRTTGKNDVVSWNMIISVCCNLGFPKRGIDIYTQMRKEGIFPDSYSLSSTLSACTDIGIVCLGRQLHCYALKQNELTEFVRNSLIGLYSKCGQTNAAYSMFRETPTKSVATWNCMISGLSQSGFSSSALGFFHEMYRNAVDMDEVTFIGAIQSCSNSGNLETGKMLHQKIVTFGLAEAPQIANALVDMYAKGGNMWEARKVFEEMRERTVVSWSTLIGGYGAHGMVEEAAGAFEAMAAAGVEPNGVTFTSILSACSHTGSVEMGKRYYEMMRGMGVEAGWEQRGCMVDLLGRAGDVWGAYGVVREMGGAVPGSVWAAFLNGCRIHGRYEVVRMVEREVMRVDVEDNGCYALLSNVYAEEGDWEGFYRLRNQRRFKRLKVPGYSASRG